MSPTVLIVTTSPTFSPARLAMALARVGCTIEAVCSPGHPLRKTRAVRQTYNYNCLFPLRSLMKAITSAKPDLVVPGDDLATQHFHELYRREQRNGQAGSLPCALIERSLGAPASFQIVYARSAFLAVAREEGIRTPTTEVVTNREELEKCASRIGFPMVLKADCTSGGDGVKIVGTLEDADRALRSLQASPSLAKACKRALIDQDMALLWPSLLGRRYVVNAQELVVGREATSAVACWRGKALAILQFEVLNRQHAGGPSTVLRSIENEEIATVAEKIARRLGLSGLHGFDFILEAKTGDPYLIEINPRATQVGHLALGASHDLPAALYASLTGQSLPPAPRLTENTTIALFPQEWLRDPTSAFIRTGYHDVPWEEPEFVLSCVQRWQKRKAWYSPQKWVQMLSELFQRNTFSTKPRSKNKT